MPRVFTRCERTGQPVATQLVMDQRSFETVRLPVFMFACAACGRVHTWRKEEAWCVEPAPRSD
jgi:hypothetical protein